MNDLPNTLRKLRRERNYTQQYLADLLDISASAYGFYEQGVSTPPYKNLVKLASIYGIQLSDLTGEVITMPIKDYKTIKVYGCVPAGIPIEAVENIEDTEDISFKEYDKNKQYIGLKVTGDSMYPKYLEGDTVIIEIASNCETNTDCVVYVNGYDATLKTVIKNDDGSITLKPLNTSYPPKTYGKGDEPVHLLGIVKEIRRRV